MKKKCVICFILLMILMCFITYANAFTLPTFDMSDMSLKDLSYVDNYKVVDAEDDLPWYNLVMFKYIFPACSILFAVLFSRAAMKKANIKVVIALAVVLALSAISTIVGSIIIHF